VLGKKKCTAASPLRHPKKSEIRRKKQMEGKRAGKKRGICDPGAIRPWTLWIIEEKKLGWREPE